MLKTDEILHYLGYRGQALADDLRDRVAAVAARCAEVSTPSQVLRTFPSGALPLELPGADIARHLRGAEEIVLFAVTLGHAVDRELRRLAITTPLDQVIFDAAATALVEREANKIEAGLRAEAARRNKFCSWRFSPGYGDLPLEVQPALLRVLDAQRRLAITLTPSGLMVPTKSVTAIVGIHAEPQPGLASSCAVCALAEHCALRGRGLRCA